MKRAPVRVAQIILDMGFGGAEKLVRDLSFGVNHDRYSKQVICLDNINSFDMAFYTNNISLSLIKRRKCKFDINCMRNIFYYIRSNQIKLLHAHDLTSLSYAAFAGFRLGIPVMMTEHSRHYIDERLLRRLEKRFLGLFTKRFVEVSPHLAEQSVARDGIPARKVLVIENGVDLERFDTANAEAFRRELGCGESSLLVGMVGRLEEIKGPLPLLRAFARIADRFPDARLVYAGTGAQRDSLLQAVAEAGLAERVHLLGTRSDIPEIMRGLDVVVLPSLSEGLPFALLEAMAAARPVVASSVGRIPQVLENESSGLLAPPGDEQALAAALEQVLDAPDRARRMGLRGREIVATRYTLQSMIRAYERIYDELLQGT